MTNGGIASVSAGTDGDSFANESGLPDHRLTTGFVYFIRRGDDGPFKVGFGTDPRKRMRAFQTASPEPLTLLHTEPGTVADEAEWHRILSEFRVRGEWFRPNWMLYKHLKRAGVAMRVCDEWKVRRRSRRA